MSEPDGTFTRWTDKQLLSLDKHTQPVTGIAFSPDGKYLASVSKDMTVRNYLKGLFRLYSHNVDDLALA